MAESTSNFLSTIMDSNIVTQSMLHIRSLVAHIHKSSALTAHLLTSLPDSVSLLQLQRLLLISPFHEDQQSPVPRFIDEGLF